MKLNELEQLDEINLRKAAAAGALGLATMGAPGTSEPSSVSNYYSSSMSAPATNPAYSKMVEFISNKYNIEELLAYKIVDLAHKYEDPKFPKAKDILSVIGVESSFNPSAVSRLKKDPARGLMQVRPGVWGIPKAELIDVEQQIAYGTKILKQYHQRFRNKWKTLHAYNIGMTKVRHGEDSPEYVQKFRDTRKQFAGM